MLYEIYPMVVEIAIIAKTAPTTELKAFLFFMVASPVFYKSSRGQ